MEALASSPATAMACRRPNADNKGGCIGTMYVASVQFKCFSFFRDMLQIFHTDVAKVDQMLHILQWLCMYVANMCPNVSSVFSDVCCKCVYLDVAYVSHICCECFIWMLRLFAMVFKFFFASVLNPCFKCSICL